MITYLAIEAPEAIRNYIEVFDYLKTFIPTVFVLLIIFSIVVIKYPENFFFIVGKLNGIIPFASKSIIKRRISSKIKADVIKATKEAHKEFEDLLPHDIEIKWEDSKKLSREAFLKENKVVVCIKDDFDENMIIVKTVYDYVKCSLLAKEKSAIDDKIVVASSITMTRNFLKKAYAKGITLFFDKLVSKEINNDESLKKLIEQMIEIDEGGFFTSVFINEVKKASSTMAGRIKNDVFVDETKEFIAFLFKIATREPGSYIELAFSKRFYKVGIILIAKSTTYEERGEAPYVSRYEQYVLDGFKGIYLFARESRSRQIDNVLAVIKHKNSYVSHKLAIFDGQSVDGQKLKGKCYILEVQKVVT